MNYSIYSTRESIQEALRPTATVELRATGPGASSIAISSCQGALRKKIERLSKQLTPDMTINEAADALEAYDHEGYYTHIEGQSTGLLQLPRTTAACWSVIVEDSPTAPNSRFTS